MNPEKNSNTSVSQQSGRRPAKIVSRILFGVGFHYIISGFILPSISNLPIFSALNASEWGSGMFNLLLEFFIAFPLVMLFYKIFIPKDILAAAEPDTLPQAKHKFGVGSFFMCFAVAVGISSLIQIPTDLLLNALSDALGAKATNIIESSTEHASLLSLILFFALKPGVLEELLFRFLPRKRLHSCGDLNFILISAFIFMIVHMNIFQIYTFASGLVFAWSYVKTKNILIPIALHFLNNALGGIVLVLDRNFNFSLEDIYGYVSIAVAVIILIVCRKKILPGLRPPAEPGWGKNAPMIPGQKQRSFASILLLNPGSIVMMIAWLATGLLILFGSLLAKPL